MAEPTIQGIVAYPVTPIRPADSRLDIPALTSLIDRLVESGVHAIAPLGSTGESAYLSDQEWDEVAEASITSVVHRVPTVVGVSDLTTAGAVRRAQAAQRYGADAVMLLPVSYWKLSERELTTHFGRVADSITIPVMAYNNPTTSGIDMSPEFLVGLVDCFANVSMIKESSGDVHRMQRIAQITGGEVPFFNGSNRLALQAFAAGAAGWCTAAPCLIAQRCLLLHEAIQGGDLRNANEHFRAMLSLLEFIKRGGLPNTVKAGLKLLGFDAGVPRPPLLELEDPAVAELARLLADVGAAA